MWQPQGFYNEYILRTPVILSGKESVRGLFDYPASRIAVIHGKSFADIELFESTFSKKRIEFFKRSWEGEPDLESLAGTIEEIERFSPDMIISVGGGSVIDGSKLCRLFYEFPYFKNGETRVEGSQMRTSFVAIPTTVGSGAEVSSAAVYIDREQLRKDMVVIHELQPEVVVYDERYVEGASSRLLVASVLDAMAHILEGYVSNVDSLMMDIVAEKGFLLIVDEMRKLLSGDESDIDYRKLQYSGYIGGLIQNHCIVGAAHAIAHQLSEYDYSHGEAVSLLISAVISANSNDMKTHDRYERIALLGGFKDISEIISLIDRLCDLVGISNRKIDLINLLRTLSNSPQFVENVKNDKGGQGNPLPITDEYIANLIEKMESK